MNKNLLVGLVVVIALVGVGYWWTMKSGQTGQLAPTTGNTVAPADSAEIVINLAEQNNSGESGVATFMEENGRVKVTLKMTGAPADVVQPAHIHTGSCPDVGGVKYPLTSPVNGMSETMLDVSLDQLRSQLPLGLNVHKSTAEAGVYVSCGDLVL